MFPILTPLPFNLSKSHVKIRIQTRSKFWGYFNIVSKSITFFKRLLKQKTTPVHLQFGSFFRKIDLLAFSINTHIIKEDSAVLESSKQCRRAMDVERKASCLCQWKVGAWNPWILVSAIHLYSSLNVSNRFAFQIVAHFSEKHVQLCLLLPAYLPSSRNPLLPSSLNEFSGHHPFLTQPLLKKWRPVIEPHCANMVG